MSYNDVAPAIPIRNLLTDSLRIIEVDEFIAELWQVHLKVKEEGYVQVCQIVACFDPC